jgi:hypothetical protein
MQTKDHLPIQGMMFNGLDWYAKECSWKRKKEEKKNCKPEGSRLTVL